MRGVTLALALGLADWGTVVGSMLMVQLLVSGDKRLKTEKVCGGLAAGNFPDP
jgi:hypothetical protein